MKIEKIHADLQNRLSPGSVILEPGKLGISGFAEQFRQLLGTDTLKIEQPVLGALMNPPGFTFEGKCSVLGQRRIPVSATFREAAGKPAVELTLEPADGWSLDKSFPGLSDSDYAAVKLAGAKLRLDSHGDDQERTSAADGLALSGRVDLPALASALSFLFDKTVQLDLSGRIRLAGSGKGATTKQSALAAKDAKLNVTSRARLPIDVSGFGMGLEEVGLAISGPYHAPALKGGESLQASFREISARLKIAGRTVTVAGAFGGEQPLVLSTTFEDFTLESLAGLIPGVNLAGQLPKGLPFPGTIELSRVSAQFDLKARSIDALSFEFDWPVDWKLAEGRLKLENLAARFYIAKPFARKQRFISAELHGSSLINGEPAVVSLYAPDYAARLYISRMEAAGIAELAGLERPEFFNELPPLVFRGVDFSYNLRSKRWSGEFEALITLLDLEFSLAVSLPAMDFHGTARTVKDGTLAKLVSDHGLVPSGKAPVLKELRVSGNPKVHRIELHADVANLISIGALSLEEAKLDLVYPGGMKSKFTGKITSKFKIDRFTFSLNAARTDTAWKATASAKASGTLDEAVKAVSQHLHGKAFKLSEHGVPEALAARKLDGELKLVVDTSKKHVSLSADIKVSDGDGKAHFEIAIGADGLVVKASLTLGDLHFEADFSKQKDSPLLAAQFISENGLKMSVAKLANSARLTDGDAFPSIGPGLEMTLRDVLVAMAPGKGKAKAKFLLAADVDGGIDLSAFGDLPLVGGMLPAGDGIKLSLAPVFANQAWDKAAVKRLNKLRGKKGPELPEAVSGSSLGISLKLPGERVPVGMDLALGDTSKGSEPAIEPGSAAPSKVTWKEIQKSLGPVQIERIGLGLDRSDNFNPAIRVLLDGGLGLGGLDLSLIGLGARYGLKKKDLSVELSGLGLELSKPPLEISGGFANLDGDYLGKVTVAMKTFSLAASGGFTMIDGKTPSMFLYGVLNTPLGGPAFFFVEGLAAGFGFNRNLIAPDLQDVPTFPFVSDAIGAAKGKKRKQGGIGAELRRLQQYVRPQLGQYFLAAGIKFSSFKLLESFVLMMVSFGRDLKIDVLGVSTYQTPPIVPPGLPAMARIELNLKASIRPLEGTLLVQAELGDNSYVYASLCRLSGGFAFAAWFAGPHAGDFVITAGGYHPDFESKRPAHYPAVPRVGLAFQVTKDIYIKGEAYFALTPSMLMAGGALLAKAEIGSVSASFRLSVDFLIAWKPYHYDARLAVDIRAKWGPFHTTAHAELHIWGPEFAGHAEVSWAFISFEVDFGRSTSAAIPISWDDFQENFLPRPDAGAKQRSKVDPAITVAAGQIATLEADNKPPVHVVNPKELEILVDSVLPVHKLGTGIFRDGKKVPDSIGCGPIGVPKVQSSTMTVTITRGGKNVNRSFSLKGRHKTFPTAMWGAHLKPELHHPASVIAGGVVQITVGEPVKPSSVRSITRGQVRYEPPPRFRRQPKPAPFHYTETTGAANKVLVPAPGAPSLARRNRILQSLEQDPGATTLRPETAGEFATAPAVMSAGLPGARP
ncbi:MAG: DUF6603 domain-containing protein [Pseudomonadota bacterium]